MGMDGEHDDTGRVVSTQDDVPQSGILPESVGQSLETTLAALEEAKARGSLSTEEYTRARSTLVGTRTDLLGGDAARPPADDSRLEQELKAEGDGGTREREIELTRALLILLRLLRARQGRATGADEALIDLHRELSRVLEAWGEISLRVGVDGLFMGDKAVLKVSPQDDPALFRVFQHGIRQLVFFPGLEIQELEDFIDVLTRELTMAESIEEDVSTLLADREFISIQFVVVETFTEGVDHDGRDRAADVADVVSAALRQQLSGELDAAKGSGGAVRFWSADVAFVKENNLKELIDALPQGEGAGGLLGQSGDKDLAAFNEYLTGALDRWTPWLPKAVLSVLQGATPEEAAGIYPLLRTQLLVDARTHGLTAIRQQLDEIATWAKEHEGQPQMVTMLREVFTSGLRAVALKGLKLRDPEGQAAAFLVLNHLPPEDRFRTLNEVLLHPASGTRRKAIKSLLGGVGMPVSELTEIMSTAEYEAAWTVVDHFRETPRSPELLALHYAATKHEEPRVRALALRWLALYSEDRAINAYRNALNDDSEMVRSAALYLLAATRHAAGPKLVYDWFDGPVFKKVEFKEKRLGAQMLANLAGTSVGSEMRKVLNRRNVTLNRTTDEMRAAAVVALAMLGDRDSEKTIGKLAQSRFSGQALKTEAAAVIAAWEAGRAPYPSPFGELNKLALHLRLVDRSSEGVTSRPPGASHPSVGAEDGARAGVRSLTPPPGGARSLTPPPGGARSLTPPAIGTRSLTPPAIGTRSLTPPTRTSEQPAPGWTPPDADGASPETEAEQAKVKRSVVREILSHYSYDDLPLTGGDAD